MKSFGQGDTGTGRRVLIVDDEPDMRRMLRMVVEKKCGCEVMEAANGRLALGLLQKSIPDVVVSDIKMPDLDGLQLMSRIREADPTISIVIMTGYGTIDMAVQAIKDGAYDFLEKPFDKDHIVRVVRNGLERTSLLRANRQLKARLDSQEMPAGFVGTSPALREALGLIARVADSDATVLIRGESGTGKELAARAVHSLSGRRNRPMITVNCPALPEHILESELFGYAKGAFTGASQEKRGLFWEAQGSTILLDEIADIPVSVQTKLLRVLQEKEIQPLGQNRTVKVDVRVVASTNQDLEAKIRAGEFREDLFYRLNVVTVTMPSLEAMVEDIPLLVHHFLHRYTKQYGKPDVVFSQPLIRALVARKWPGNVRELRNTIKRLVLLAGGDEVGVAELDSGAVTRTATAEGASRRFDDLHELPYGEAKNSLIAAFSESYLCALLRRNGGNVTSAAAECGMERQALQRLLRRYGIVSADFKC